LSSTYTQEGSSKLKKPGFIRRRLIEPFIKSVHPPWFDARGIAMGMFVGLGVPIGLHMLTLGLARLAFRYNSAIAIAVTFVNNPVTLIPMYYGYYYLGSVVLGVRVAMSLEDFSLMMHPIIHADHFGGSARQFLALGGELLLRWTIGSLIFSGIVTAISYAVGYSLLKKRCMRKARKCGTTYEEFTKRLEASMKSSVPEISKSFDCAEHH
jgi:uncharacterized protein